MPKRARDHQPHQPKTKKKSRKITDWRIEDIQTHNLEVQKNNDINKLPYITSNDSAKADIIPLFDPENNETSCDQWLNKIDHLATIHQWPEQKKVYYMQTRLAGMAKVWHGSLKSYDMTWNQWKELMLEAFPQKLDFVEGLREMLNKCKTSTESMTQYFYSKLAMLNKLDISDEKAVACIIDGLPHNMKAPARAGNYKKPGKLFAQFLSVMTDTYKKDITMKTKTETMEEQDEEVSQQRQLQQRD